MFRKVISYTSLSTTTWEIDRTPQYGGIWEVNAFPFYKSCLRKIWSRNVIPERRACPPSSYFPLISFSLLSLFSSPVLVSFSFNQLTTPKATNSQPFPQNTGELSEKLKTESFSNSPPFPIPGPPPSLLFHLVMQMKISRAVHLTKIIWKCQLRWNWKNGESG